MIIINYLLLLFILKLYIHYKDIKEKVDNLGFNLGFAVIAKEMEIQIYNSDKESKTRGKAMSKGLSKFKKISIDKAKGAVSSSWYNAIKKNIRE